MVLCMRQGGPEAGQPEGEEELFPNRILGCLTPLTKY